MRNGVHRYNINRTRPRHGHMYTKYRNVYQYDGGYVQ